jgi:hypothetical protein
MACGLDGAGLRVRVLLVLQVLALFVKFTGPFRALRLVPSQLLGLISLGLSWLEFGAPFAGILDVVLIVRRGLHTVWPSAELKVLSCRSCAALSLGLVLVLWV